MVTKRQGSPRKGSPNRTQARSTAPDDRKDQSRDRGADAPEGSTPGTGAGRLGQIEARRTAATEDERSDLGRPETDEPTEVDPPATLDRDRPATTFRVLGPIRAGAVTDDEDGRLLSDACCVVLRAGMIVVELPGGGLAVTDAASLAGSTEAAFR